MSAASRGGGPPGGGLDPALDPRGLIREAYRIEAISDAQCRSILLDWAIGLPAGRAHADALGGLLAHYGPLFPTHPMTALLRAGLDEAPGGKRRGGASARRAQGTDRSGGRPRRD